MRDKEVGVEVLGEGWSRAEVAYVGSAAFGCHDDLVMMEMDGDGYG